MDRAKTGISARHALPDVDRDALQTVVSRRTKATDAAVVSVTQIHGGDTWNVIPEQVVLRGTVRTLDAAVQEKTVAAMRQVCEGVGQTHGAKVALDYRYGYQGVINTAAETEAAIAVAAGLVGADKVHTDIQPTMGSEDFAFMLQKRPGAYIVIGAGEGSNARRCTTRTTISTTTSCRWAQPTGWNW